MFSIKAERRESTLQDMDMVKQDRVMQTNNEHLSGLDHLPDGLWDPTFRPIATGYVTPGRGHESHGTDQDTPAEAWGPDQTGGVIPIQDNGPAGPEWFEKGSDQYAKAIRGKLPLYVSVLADPLSTETKVSTTRTVIDGTFTYSSQAFSGVDPTNVVVIPRDSTRQKLTLTVRPNYGNLAANQAPLYVFAVSHDRQFAPQNYIILDSGQIIEFDGTDPLYVGIFPIAVNDPSKQNNITLSAVIETTLSLDYNPARPGM